MNKPLYIFIGKSASGKTTVANIFEGSGRYTQLQSYTTRLPRYRGEIGHIFISEEEFDALENLVAYTEYNGYRYGATAEQVDNVDIYVIDIPGFETLLEKYNTKRPIVIIYFDASICTRIDRMIDRGDSDTVIVSRLYTDEKDDWERQLHKIAWHCKNNENRDVEMYIVDANQDLAPVVAQITQHIADHKKESSI